MRVDCNGLAEIIRVPWKPDAQARERYHFTLAYDSGFNETLLVAAVANCTSEGVAAQAEHSLVL